MAAFYEDNHNDYFRSTVTVDPTPFLGPFANMLCSGSTVLDVGCGSGRDLRWLADRGFEPTGFEVSPGLVKLARDYSNRPVIEGDFTLFDFSTLLFDAILLIGALVHVERSEFPSVLSNICQALKNRGLVLLSMKECERTSGTEDGRIFIHWQREHLEEVLRGNDFKTSVSGELILPWTQKTAG